MLSEYRICALIPVYNHGSTVNSVVEAVKARGLEVILVDDGSDDDTRLALESISKHDPLCNLVRLESNSGKGGAVIAGLRTAVETGFSHALQIDADGQHDLGKIREFMDDSRMHPHSLIAGAPIYDETAPSSRLIGRKITNFWVSIETISRDIHDSMCGFRVYPVEKTIRALKALHVDKRMGFDIEVLVRLHWLGVPIRFHSVQVEYPEGGISNFRMVRDNIGISLAHTKLFFGMIPRLPVILYRRLTQR